MDLERLREVGEEGVRLLMSDSTNVFRTGSTRGEASVEEALFDLIEDAPGRVVVGQFSSNVYRMRAVLEVAARAGRRVCVFGRSARTHMDLARQMGIIETTPHQLVDPSEASDVPRHKLLVIATGTQGEPNAALGRFARREMRDLDLEEGDEIILSSHVIPGHEYGWWLPIHHRLHRRALAAACAPFILHRTALSYPAPMIQQGL